MYLLFLLSLCISYHPFLSAGSSTSCLSRVHTHRPKTNPRIESHMMFMIRQGNPAVRSLLDHSVIDKKGLTVLMWAAAHGRDKLVEYLLNLQEPRNINAQTTAQPSTALLRWEVNTSDSKDLSSFWVTAAADYQNLVLDKGTTALMLAVGFNHHAVVTLLLEEGADLGLRTSSGRTAIEYIRNDSMRATIARFQRNFKKAVHKVHIVMPHVVPISEHESDNSESNQQSANQPQQR